MPLPKVETVKDILFKINYKDRTLSKKEVESLLNLKFLDENMFSLKDRNFILDAVGLINSVGFEEAYKYFKSKEKEKSRSSIIFDSSDFEDSKRRFFLETTRDLRKIRVESYIKCKRCKLNTVETVTKQLRSADEGATDIHTCWNCGFSWRE